MASLSGKIYRKTPTMRQGQIWECCIHPRSEEKESARKRNREVRHVQRSTERSIRMIKHGKGFRVVDGKAFSVSIEENERAKMRFDPTKGMPYPSRNY
jgi:hypothetical protein